MQRNKNQKRAKLILLSIIFLTACTQNTTPETTTSLETTQICFQDKCIQAEIAKTTEEKKTGLMFRESLAENNGMIFPYDEKENHTFWMKNTLIPLDMIWISDNKIVHIETATPCTEEKPENCERYNSPVPANYILEVNAGFTEKNNIQSGDTIEINIP